MKAITTVELKDKLSDTLNEAAFGKERIVVTRRGKGLAALVPIDDLEVLEALEDARDAREARKALKELRDKNEKPVRWSDIKREAGL